MSVVSVIPADRSLIDAILPHLEPAGVDYSANVVVFPGKRPAHTLRKTIAERIGRSLLPPRVFSIDHFIEHLYVEKLQLRGTALETIDAVGFLYEIQRKASPRIGGEQFLTLEAFYPLGIKIFGELEELRMANISLRRIREVLSAMTYGELPSLPLFYERFYAMADERSFATRAMKYRAVAENVAKLDLREWKRIVCAGFFALTPPERTIFRHLLDHPGAIQIYQNGPGLGRQLKESGLSVELPPPSTKRPVVKLIRSPDTHGQVLTLSREINALRTLGKSAIDRTAVVLLAAETLLPVIHQPLALVPDEEFNISLEYPVTRTPVYGFLQAVMELLSTRSGTRYSAKQYIKFMLHPYAKNIRYGRRSDVTRILFNTVEELFLEGRTSPYFLIEELENDGELFERAARRASGVDETVTAESLRQHLCVIHAKTIGLLSRAENLGDVAGRAVEMLSYIHDHSTAKFHPLFRSFAETLIEQLDRVSISLLRGERFSDFALYESFMNNYLSAGKVAFAGTPLRGLQVLGFLETRNLQFDRVFLLDVNDDVLPGAKGHDVFLSLKVRETLGLPTYRDAERLVEYHFHLLLQGAQEVFLFFVEGGKKEKSRFIEKLLWEEQQRDKKTDPDDYVRSLRYAIQLANPAPPEISKTTETTSFLKRFVYSATSLDTYLRCQLRFYYRYVLKLREKEAVSDELGPTDVGTFVHDILAEYFGELRGKKVTVGAIDVPRLADVINTLFARKYGSDPVGAHLLLREQTKRHLSDFLLRHQQPLAERDLTLIDVETKLQATIGGFRFAGTLDRIERRGDKVYVLDYKSGSNEKDTRIRFKRLVLDDRESWDEAVGSFQLPLYAFLYSKTSGTRVEEISPAYLFLGRGEIDGKVEQPLFQEEGGRTEGFDLLEKVLVGLVNEAASTDQPFRRPRRLDKQCPRCEFKYICGTQWTS